MPLRELRGFGKAEQAFFDTIAADAAQGSVKWADVAAGAGFSDQSHLCRVTRRITGFTPQALYDGILIKENHIAAASGLTAAFRAAQVFKDRVSFIQVEVETLRQLREALDAGVDMVLLDNMTLPTLLEAVRMNQSKGTDRAILEISGGVTLDGLRALAETGVDRISIGTLTKDVVATDYSMRFDTFAGAQ